MSMSDLSLLQTQLVKAIKQEDNLTLEQLTRVKYVNPNFETKYGFPIQLASYSKCNIQTLKLLLDAGADPNKIGFGTIKRSALENAIANKNLEAVRLLMKSGAYVNRRDDNKPTPLHASIYYDAFDVTKFLLDTKAGVNARNRYGLTPLHMLVKKTSNPRPAINVFDMLIEAGANLNQGDSDGFTPLHLAVCEGQVNIVVLLMERGANFHAETKLGDTALHLACRHGKLDMLQLLIKVGLPIESQNHMKCTPLHIAVDFEQTLTVFYLVKAGADVNAIDVRGRSPIVTTAKRQDLECLNIFLTAGSRVSPELSDIECFHPQVKIFDHSNPLGAYMKHLSCHPSSLRDTCILNIRRMLAPYLQIKAYLLPVPDALQQEIALETLSFDDLSNVSKFNLHK